MDCTIWVREEGEKMKKVLFLLVLLPLLFAISNGEEYYYEPWISSTQPIRINDPIQIRNEKGEFITLFDSLKTVYQEAEFVILAIQFDENGNPDTIEVEIENVLIWEKTTNLKRPVIFEDSIPIYMVKRIKKGKKPE